MFKDNLLKNKTIVVTGGGSGLGKSMARRFGELGANLVISGRRKEVLEEAAHEFSQQNIDEIKTQIESSEEKIGDVIEDSVLDPLKEKTETIKNNLDALK